VAAHRGYRKRLAAAWAKVLGIPQDQIDFFQTQYDPAKENLWEQGWGVLKDQMEAYFWDRLAVKYHTIYGNRVPFRATPEQFANLEKRLAAWIAAHPNPAESR
jgi:hypothetical protein